ncbi:Hypothetical Protein MPH_10712 [Macrophomina phaseolina MS6]|uniref:Uncharacterized protein n=1 Tax=Macrophomina phaseolina (strain MS6) TaxID=1126212 RepID=K2RC61_MACPH|nr:Hypothetical Protein MPH_10712 [Macrophomina phaseolina MS6]
MQEYLHYRVYSPPQGMWKRLGQKCLERRCRIYLSWRCASHYPQRNPRCTIQGSHSGAVCSRPAGPVVLASPGRQHILRDNHFDAIDTAKRMKRSRIPWNNSHSILPNTFFSRFGRSNNHRFNLHGCAPARYPRWKALEARMHPSMTSDV